MRLITPDEQHDATPAILAVLQLATPASSGGVRVGGVGSPVSQTEVNTDKQADRQTSNQDDKDTLFFDPI